MNKILSRLAFILMAVAFISSSAAAQEFQKSYNLGAGGRINVSSVSGDVTVTGYDGNEVVVKGFKKGRDRDQVSVEDNSTADSVVIKLHYPESCRCDASVDFQVQVPRSVRYNFDKISSASGDIQVSGVTGELIAKSASGDVKVSGVNGSVQAGSASGDVKVDNIAGTVSARSASGDVKVEIVRLEGAGNMEFSSASGDVHVKAPAGLDAEIEMSTLSGDLNTSFPLQISKKQYGPGQSASGKLGGGSRRLKLKSVSGDVSLTTEAGGH